MTKEVEQSHEIETVESILVHAIMQIRAIRKEVHSLTYKKMRLALELKKEELGQLIEESNTLNENILKIVAELPDKLRNASQPVDPSHEGFMHIETFAQDARTMLESNDSIGAMIFLVPWGSRDGDPDNLEWAAQKYFAVEVPR